MKNPIVLVVGTRAEAIKLIPVYQKLVDNNIPAVLCATYQHDQLLRQACEIFSVVPHYNLAIMRPNQDLFHITGAVLEKTRDVYRTIKPRLVLVHGDTTTTFAASLAAFYLHIPLGHVEAGLRTGNMQKPFPEEMNRKVVGQIADYHFAPTPFSTAHLLAEGVSREKIFCTGNTIVDALFGIRQRIINNQIAIDSKIQNQITQAREEKKKIILFTAHRRESFGAGLIRIFAAVKQFAQAHDDILIFYPHHPNPHVLRALEQSGINTVNNIVICKPLMYKDLVYVLMAADWVATDSGGIQEEAVSLGKQVLVLRDITERWEGVWEGSEVLVGTDKESIIKHMEKLYKKNDVSFRLSSVYGDGRACEKIVSIIRQRCMGQENGIIHQKNNVADLGQSDCVL